MSPPGAQQQLTRILIVEDDVGQRQTLTELLREEGYEATSCATAHAALAEFERREYAVAIVDYRLPDLSGTRLLERLRGRNRDTRVIIHTGFGSFESAKEAVNLGAFAYVEKLGDPETLIRHVHRAMESRMSEALAVSEGRFRTITENAPDFVCQVDREGTITYANHPLPSMPVQDVVGRSVVEWVNAEHRQIVRDALDQSYWTGRLQQFEVSAPGPDAEPNWYSARVGPVVVNGRVVSSILIACDITERRRAEDEMRRLVTAIEQAAEVILITDPDGIIQYVNPAFERVTGYRREEAVGKTPGILRSGKHDGTFYRDFWETVTRGQTWAGRFSNRRKDGSLYEAEATITPVRDGVGRIINYVDVMRDVTDNLALEARLRQAQKMEAVGTLAGGVAHDFNNIVTAIFGFAQLARLYAGEEKAVQAIGKIEEAAQAAAGVTRALLTFSRKEETRKSPIDLTRLVRQSIRLLRRFVSASIEIVTEISSRPVWIEADKTQLQQVLMNLTVNARDAMPNGGRLRITVRPVKEEPAAESASGQVRSRTVARLVFEDSGTGMSPEIVERILEPFFTTKPREQGTGLGLAIIHGIVTEHDGQIEIQTEERRGTRVILTFPCCAPLEPGDPAPRSTVEKCGKGESIVLAEDNKQVQTIMAAVLRSAGFTVIQASDGPAAMAAVEAVEGGPQLVVLDVDLPKKSGLACLHEMRGAGSRLPVLVIAGDPRLTLEEGDTDRVTLLRKPFQMTELIAAVCRALESCRIAEGHADGNHPSTCS